MPKISVIIPVYNTEKYLKKCLDSVINQTLKDIEIICIDDCSTDNSLAILKDYIARDSRIKLIELPQNQGAGNAKNAGLKLASGEYLSFVDPDDYIDLNFYEELYKNAVTLNADVVKCDLITVEPGKSGIKSSLNQFIKNISKFYFSYEYTSAIYRTSIVFENNITFPEELIVGEDVVFLHKFILKTKRIEIINSTNYYYVRRFNSLNAHVYDRKRMKSAISTVEYMAKNYDDSYEKDISKEEYLSNYISNMFLLIRYTITRTDDTEIKHNCVEKFIELFNKCKMQNELEQYFQDNYPEVFDLIKENNIEKLFQISTKYKNFQNFCTIERLRKNVKKDIQNAKSISNNTGI